MIDGQKSFDQRAKNDIRAYDNFWKIATGQKDDYTTGWLLDYSYFKELYKLTAIDLSKQETFHADPKAIKQINFTGNLERPGNTVIFSFLKNQKKTFKIFWEYCKFILL